MNLPSFPTDNLYKFVALSGVFLFAIACLYPLIVEREIRTELIQIEGEQELLKLHKLPIDNKLFEIRKKLDQLTETSGCNCEAIVTDTVIIRPAMRLNNEQHETYTHIENLITEWVALNQERNMKTLALNTNINLTNNKTSQLEETWMLASISIPFSLLLTLLGFSAWYHKTQALQDRILKNQFLETARYECCQSCGIDLVDDRAYERASNDERRRTIYCSECFSEGVFKEPDLTIEQMKDKVTRRCVELKIGKSKRNQVLKSIRFLKRWSPGLHWKF